jgi:acetyl-CoA carboxylase biotin carboxyl carrier protein
MSQSSKFTNDDVEQILNVVDRLNDIEVKLETDSFKLHVRKFSGSAPPSQVALARLDVPAEQPSAPAVLAAPRAASAGRAAPQASADAIAIRAPMLGRFYRAPSPAEPPFVEVGTRIGPEDAVCIIEVMKLFKTVSAGVNGVVTAISVEDGAMVEYNEVLFLVRPD